MRRPAALISVCFCAGMLGALIGIAAVSGWELLGFPDLGAYTLRPLLAPAGLYPRLIWGGLWGVLYFSRSVQRGPASTGFRKVFWSVWCRPFIIWSFLSPNSSAPAWNSLLLHLLSLSS